MTHRPHHLRGFTLIELIIVLVILSIMIALAAPTLRGWGNGQKLRNTVESFVAATGYARSQAVTTATPYVVEIDSSANTFVVKTVGLDGLRKAATGDFGTPSSLPESYTIHLLSGGSIGSVMDGQTPQGTASIMFYPDSRCTPAAVEIKGTNDDVARVESVGPADPFKQVTTK